MRVPARLPACLSHHTLPDDIYTADVTGDGVNDFVMVWGGAVAGPTAIATNHQQASGCEQWRYISAPYEIQLAVFPTTHDVWLAHGRKLYEDSQGNRCPEQVGIPPSSGTTPKPTTLSPRYCLYY